MAFNPIQDVNILAGLTELEWLTLDGNQIVDISALADLPKLVDIDLTDNLIKDLGPLAANEYLGVGKAIQICYNRLDLSPGSKVLDDIAILESRGVKVWYDPQSEMEEEQENDNKGRVCQ